MSLAASPQSNRSDNTRRWLAKSVILLIISLGLFAFSAEFSPVRIFEPQSIGWILWFSYANDLILPFVFYLLLCLGERWLPAWRARAIGTFTLFAFLEFGQLFYYRVSSGHYVGSFDPLDFVMYAIGMGLAVFVEQKVLPRIFRFW